MLHKLFFKKIFGVFFCMIYCVAKILQKNTRIKCRIKNNRRGGAEPKALRETNRVASAGEPKAVAPIRRVPFFPPKIKFATFFFGLERRGKGCGKRGRQGGASPISFIRHFICFMFPFSTKFKSCSILSEIFAVPLIFTIKAITRCYSFWNCNRYFFHICFAISLLFSLQLCSIFHQSFLLFFHYSPLYNKLFPAFSSIYLSNRLISSISPFVFI